MRRKLAHERKEKHAFGVNLSVNFSTVIAVAFAAFCKGAMDRGKGTPGENGTAVHSCSLQLAQVQLCSLLVIPDVHQPLKAAAKVESFAKLPNFGCPEDSLECLQEKPPNA